MDAREWLEAFAGELGAEVPSEDEMNELLAIAGIAAHSSERIAAPIACFIGGRAGVSIEQMRAAAERVAAAAG